MRALTSGQVGWVKEPWELNLMRAAGRKLAEVSAEVRERVRIGVTTLELDAIAEAAIRRVGAAPCFKGYVVGDSVPFPASICASPNQVVVHGIPDERPLVDGDLLSIDLGLVAGGYHADCAFSVALGTAKPRVTRLLDATERSMYEGVARALAGNHIGDIGHAIESFIRTHRFGIVADFVGHGIGRRMHESPSVPNYGVAGKGHLLHAGMCLAIEPMITLGTDQTEILDDGWTVVTADGSLAAHFEHTVAITSKGPEILTVLEGDNPLSRFGIV